MLNFIVIQGRIVHTPELRYTAAKTPVCSFSVACDRPYKNGEKNGTDFINCVAWNKTAEFVDKFLSKGQLCIVSGRLRQEKYTGRDGTEKTKYEIQCTEVNFCGSKKEQLDAAEQDAFEASRKRPTQNDVFTDIDVDDSDLPF